MKQGSFAFRYTDVVPHLLLDSIGWHTTDSPTYGNDGNARTDHDHIVFQYTLRGEGRIEVNGQMHRLMKGQAFLVKIPSDHRYYYDATTLEPWQFLWLNAKGEDALRMAERIIAEQGNILTIDQNSFAITSFWDMYRTISEDQLTDSTELSVLLYQFILALSVPKTTVNNGIEHVPIVSKAIRYIKDHVAKSLTLDDIAAHCNVSGAYLCRLFQRSSLVSPLEYLRRRKIELAISMLRTTELSAQDIGKQCGFDSASYFSKTFKVYLGFTPSDYRKHRTNYPFYTVFLD
ncbi:AraC family transcriptional regulator [Paenibacillus yanchengensis]|uniref:AraC family transcriptional regulator n=1 Tax=Paenibacillus yanchengensis TaxID=2035833 RepID=A0ABW4YHG1_9BACL